MKNLLTFALLASMVTSAPTQGYAQDESVATTIADTATSDAFAGSALTAAAPMVLQAVGCCDQGYEVKSAVQAPGCCDQGYVTNAMSATTRIMVAIVALSLLALSIVQLHFRNTTQLPWTSSR